MKYKFDIDVFGTGKLTKAMKSMSDTNEQFGMLDDHLKNTRKSLGVLSDFKTIRFLDDMEDKFVSITKQTKLLNDIGGFKGLVVSKFQEMGQIFSSLGNKGTLGSLKSIGLVFKSWVLPIALVTAAIYTLKKMWDWNVGNMQGQWTQFTTSLTNMWNKFEVQFMKFLYSYGPMFEKIIAGFLIVLKGAVWLFLGFIKVLIKFKYLVILLTSVWAAYKVQQLAVLAYTKMQAFWTGVLATKEKIATAAQFLHATALKALAVGQALYSTSLAPAIASTWAFATALWATGIPEIVLGVAALAAGFVWLYKKTDILQRSWKGWTMVGHALIKVFGTIWKVLKKVFYFAWENSPLGLALKGISKAVSWFEDDNSKAAVTGAKTGANTSNNTNNNNVTIHTTNLTDGVLGAVKAAFLPAVSAAGRVN